MGIVRASHDSCNNAHQDGLGVLRHEIVVCVRHFHEGESRPQDAGVWAIPAARMKAKRDHRVPLSSRALAILHDVQKRSDGTGLVFRSLRGKPLSAVTLPRLTKELGIAAVPHGFRSSFRDWARNGRTHPAKWSRPHSPIRYKTPPRRPTRVVISSSAGAA